MFVKVDGKEYAIDFSYDKPRDVPNIRLTHCILSEVLSHAGKDIEAVVLGIGSSSCNPHDNFKKSTGRKLAFLRAMIDAQIEREDRRLFWNEFFKQVRRS